MTKKGVKNLVKWTCWDWDKRILDSRPFLWSFKKSDFWEETTKIKITQERKKITIEEVNDGE